MAYPVGYKEIMMTSSEGRIFLLASKTAAEMGRVMPAFFADCILKRVVVVPISTRAITSTGKATLSIRLATTAGATSATGMQQDTMTVPTTTGAHRGKAFYSPLLNVRVRPGQEIILHKTVGATGTYSVRVGVVVQPQWEEPANNSLMVDAT